MEPQDSIDVNAIDQLLSLLRGPVSNLEESLKPENLRYILYARRSTIDEGRQEKSLSQQIDECVERVVKPENIALHNEDIIEEKGSAKEPDIRPGFRRMLNAIIAGKYDGIIAWHPDRLARNMKEAGEIIDLLDKGIIKDLRFATSTFENSPTGKMLLGISFVLSKQYSEHLSESVTRGNRHKTQGGKFLGSYKHGYLKTEDGKLFPDAQNWVIIQHAFEMRLNGESQSDIMKYLNGHKDYQIYRHKKGGHVSYSWDKDSVSKLLSDPVFAGVLKYGSQSVNLIELYGFTPLIEAADFLKINKAKNFASAKLQSAFTSPRSGIKAHLLNGLIRCDHCGKILSSGIVIKANGDNFYRYRCETDGCLMKNKGPRAKVITDFAIDYLDKYHFTTRHNYSNYIKEVARTKEESLIALNRLLASLDKQIETKQKDYDNAKRIASDPTNVLHKHYIHDLDNYREDLKVLKKAFKEAQAQKLKLKSAIPTYEKYLELFDNVAVILRKQPNIWLMDQILRKFFSNFTVRAEFVAPKNKITRWKVVDYKLKEPYAGFLKTNDFDLGRGDRT
jgi:DNA invertase Pin-like site-specific DNA recombinase/phage FluMu protein Com